MVASISRCRSVRVLLVAVVSCPQMTDTIIVFSVWASNTLKMRSWFESCACCGRMSMTSLQSRLSFLKGLTPSAATHAGFSCSSREPPAGALGDLRVRASPVHMSPRTSYSSCSERLVRFPGNFRWSVPRGAQHFIRHTIRG